MNKTFNYNTLFYFRDRMRPYGVRLGDLPSSRLPTESAEKHTITQLHKYFDCTVTALTARPSLLQNLSDASIMIYRARNLCLVR